MSANDFLEQEETEMDQQKRETYLSLLRRGGVSEDTIYALNNDGELRIALHVVSDLIGESAPDVSWRRQYFEVTGVHAVLTEVGWFPAEANNPDITGEDPLEVYDEVNHPSEISNQKS